MKITKFINKLILLIKIYLFFWNKKNIIFIIPILFLIKLFSF